MTIKWPASLFFFFFPWNKIHWENVHTCPTTFEYQGLLKPWILWFWERCLSREKLHLAHFRENAYCVFPKSQINNTTVMTVCSCQRKVSLAKMLDIRRNSYSLALSKSDKMSLFNTLCFSAMWWFDNTERYIPAGRTAEKSKHKNHQIPILHILVFLCIKQDVRALQRSL